MCIEQSIPKEGEGVAWIQVDAGIKEHDKIFNLADTLKITDAHAVGLMVCLWTWAVTSAPDGDVTNFPPRAIAKAAGWDKKPDDFMQAICAPASLFIENIDGKMKFRNWDERAALLMDAVERGREQTKKRVQRYRKRKKGINDVTETDSDSVSVTVCNDDVTVDESVTTVTDVTDVTNKVTLVTHLPYHTIPIPINNRTYPPIPPQKNGGGDAEDAHPGDRQTVETCTTTAGKSTAFDSFWAQYPKKVGKEAARRAWNKIKPNSGLRQKIAEAITLAKQRGQWLREHGRFIPNPATWLNQGRWDDEPVPEGGADRYNQYNEAILDGSDFDGEEDVT